MAAEKQYVRFMITVSKSLVPDYFHSRSGLRLSNVEEVERGMYKAKEQLRITSIISKSC
ncbi:hypothetical protein BWQ96_04114 [Gracilariopsis chorda]|uniref:Uncharacterized protein n=1 Tax=Gracilariopsis chorda TaxID=448386 RepID=A0A2V3IVD7_9FLOR|nr:hypothetical protein BWQ96_04114 [Gracilariopsis chorda]|eukprot:PXF46108.1 hypothetical protein BWQ96_04114 [Gracilariopsis chorda]